MEKLGEYTLAAKFPEAVSVFSIKFYGASGKGKVFVNIYNSGGALISAVTLTDVTNGPYYFTSDTLILGFTIHTIDTGGIAIRQIKYGLPTGLVPHDEPEIVYIWKDEFAYYTRYEGSNYPGSTMIGYTGSLGDKALPEVDPGEWYYDGQYYPGWSIDGLYGYKSSSASYSFESYFGPPMSPKTPYYIYAAPFGIFTGKIFFHEKEFVGFGFGIDSMTLWIKFTDFYLADPNHGELVLSIGGELSISQKFTIPTLVDGWSTIEFKVRFADPPNNNILNIWVNDFSESAYVGSLDTDNWLITNPATFTSVHIDSTHRDWSTTGKVQSYMDYLHMEEPTSLDGPGNYILNDTFSTQQFLKDTTAEVSPQNNWKYTGSGASGGDFAYYGFEVSDYTGSNSVALKTALFRVRVAEGETAKLRFIDVDNNYEVGLAIDGYKGSEALYHYYYDDGNGYTGSNYSQWTSIPPLLQNSTYRDFLIKLDIYYAGEVDLWIPSIYNNYWDYLYPPWLDGQTTFNIGKIAFELQGGLQSKLDFYGVL